MEIANTQTVTPDVVEMQNLQDQIFQLIGSWEMNVLPAAREQLDELCTLLLAVERAFKESLIGGIVLLEDRRFIPGVDSGASQRRLASVLERLNQHHAHLARKTCGWSCFRYRRLSTPCQSWQRERPAFKYRQSHSMND